MGSKSRIAKHIVPIIQEYIDKNNIKKYVEPFVGGANIIDKIQCAEKYGFDKNKYLIALLKRVQNGEKLYKEKYQKSYMTKQERLLTMGILLNLKIGKLGILVLSHLITVVGLMVDTLKPVMKKQKMD